MKTASYEKEDAEEIDEVVDPQPHGEAEFSRVWVHIRTSFLPIYALRSRSIRPPDRRTFIDSHGFEIPAMSFPCSADVVTARLRWKACRPY